MAIDLITKAEYKAYAGISSTNQDAQITAIIPKVSQLVKNYCRRTFVDHVDDVKIETFNGGWGGTFSLSEYPLISVSDVEYSADYGQTYTSLVEYEDYVIDLAGAGIVAISEYAWIRALNGYKVSYFAGYEELPADLKLAVADLVTYYLKNDMSVHSPKAPGTNSVQVEYITTSALPAHIRRILDLYKASWD